MSIEASSTVTRRAVLAGACTCGALALAACAGDADSTAAEPVAPSAATTVPLSSVPVGGAILDASAGEPLVISQPEAGDVHVVSAICTHQGCQIAVDGDALACPCHGSRYDLTGVVTNGPAERPLPAVRFELVDDEIRIA